jgi:2-dehydro-3-deoxygluconokinase
MSDLEVITVGEPLVALIAGPHGTSLVDAQSFSAHVVGAELNAAVGLARLGHRVGYVGRIGRDPFGALIRRRLIMEGVDVEFLLDDDRPTGLIFRNLRAFPPPEVVYRRQGSAGSSLQAGDVASALTRLHPGGLVLLSGVTAAVCPEVTAGTSRAAAANGHRVVLDLNYRARLWPPEAAAAGLSQLLEYAFLVVGTVEEARLLTSSSDLGVAVASIIGAGPEMVVLRDQKVRARLYRRGDEPVTVTGREAFVVDAVGAGDAFLAGLLSGLLDSGFSDLEGAVARGHLCGAAVVGAVGDIEGALRREELGNVANDEPVR